MANVAWASGHILCFDDESADDLLGRIDRLAPEPQQGDFSIWKGIFNAPEAPQRAGRIITFGLSHKYFGETDEIGRFLGFWEALIDGVRASELFIALEQEFMHSELPFGKFYFQWKWQRYPKSTDGRWVFCGMPPADEHWKSRFETEP